MGAVGSESAQVSEQEACAAARNLVAYAKQAGIIEAEDGIWAYNTLIGAVGASGCAPVPDAGTEPLADVVGDASENAPSGFQAALDVLVRFMQQRGTAPKVGDGATGLSAYLMGLIMPRPSQVQQTFERLYAADSSYATDWFFRLSGDVDYVRRAAIARNIAWTTPTRWGDLEITVNLSKPEKDPRAIASAGKAPTGAAYPACALCLENEGYAGRPAESLAGAHAARQNLRVVSMELGGERWGLQYSPYAYYDQHCIVISSVHRPMHIDRSTFARLLQFVQMFPHYFVGSNADLPLVGGSILSHDHFQGGAHVFPMQKAPIDKSFEIAGFPQVEAGIVRWPTSVLRLRCEDAGPLVDAACRVLDVWRGWSDEQAGIVAESAGARHNTITPIACKADGCFQLDLALRCNVTDDEHPWGVFHPHEGLHHIKKENIGLIEVMGLAILPPRLAPQLEAVERALVSGDGLNDPLCAPHAAWAREVARKHSQLNEGNVSAIVRDEVGQVFAQVLECTGVFKWDAAGRRAQERFLDALS